jgi:hypothetical protein
VLKVNSLNVFDRNFFGKPMKEWANRKIVGTLPSSNIKLDSVDDFNKHFQQKLFNFKGGNNVIVKDTFDLETIFEKPSIF